jgi:ribonuclease-3 family protein
METLTTQSHLLRGLLSVHSPLGTANTIETCHPRALAHLGDGVFELLVREWAMARLGLLQVEQLHNFSIGLARAETQVVCLQWLLPQLTEAEEGLYKQARNMPVTQSRRKQQGLYRQSTGFEALVGWWYLHNPERLLLLETWFLTVHESSS